MQAAKRLQRKVRGIVLRIAAAPKRLRLLIELADDREYLSAAQRALWAGVLSLVMVTRVVCEQASGAQSTEVRYFLSSLPPIARRLGSAIRGHWSIENGLHWVLDVVFREDARRVYDRTTAENVAFLNRLAVSLLRGDSGKGSLKVGYLRALNVVR